MTEAHLSRAPESGASATLIELGRDALGTVDQTSRREWLVTNGIGGFAAGTLSLLNTRRYHGLLFAALRPPVDRVAMISKLDVGAWYGGAHVPLASNEFADGTIAPRGYRHLESFRLEGLVPVWTWLIADARIEQRLWMRHGENTTYVQFTRIGGSKDLRLSIEPLCTYRDYHSQSRGERAFQVGPVVGGVRIQAHEGARPYRILGTGAELALEPQWHWSFRHREETARGLDDLEDVLRPARFTLRLESGQPQALVLTAEAHEPMPASEALSLERERQAELLERARRMRSAAPSPRDSLPIDRLALAADQFLVERRDPEAGMVSGKTVIAGYPWFSDWGRDTMIALPGLTLATGRSDIAVSVLRTFAKFVDQGMLPNRFPDAGEIPEYNTADASLWFFVAIHEYLRASDDHAFAGEIYPTLRGMLEWHVRGTRFGIRMDEADSLLRAGESGVQLTWMDAKVGDWVVTARIGKPVEINALWFNAVSILRDLASDLGQAEDQVEYALLAERIRVSFEQRFWFEAGGYLYDVIDGPEGDADEAGRRCDRSLRPNQIFALSLPHALLSGEKARRVLETCMVELWTPVGLRSLAPHDARYVGFYGGGPRERDGAYHQGTIWTWLLGPLVTAHYRLHGDAAVACAQLNGITAHLREGCIGSLSEIMDGDAPFDSKGCFAQAWAVAEVLRAWSDIDDIERSRQRKRETLTAPRARPVSR
jgi:predicted glycogen debranching enzyme